jgi:hypothetical protein
MSNANQLIRLQIELEAANQEYTQIMKDQKAVQKKSAEKMKQVQDIKKKIKVLASPTLTDIVVTDHAIVRYLERVKGVDIEEIRRSIVTEKVKEMIDTLGTGLFPINNEFRIKVQDKRVITVMAKK